MAEKGFGVKEINLIGASGTPTIESPNNLNLNAVNVAISTNVSIGGTLTVSGNVSVGGTLTYEDVTNIDSVGIITARNAIDCNGDIDVDGHTNLDNVNISGITTFANNVHAANVFTSYLSSTSGLVAPYADIDDYVDVGSNIKLGNAGVVTATSFSGSGANLTSLPAANITGTLPAISGANLTGIAVTEAPVVDYTITANGSSAYRFHGGGVDETADNPDLYLVRGQKYRFNNTTGSSHPFALRVSSGGSAYTDGVTGSQNGIQFFTVPYSSPASLVYQCTIHGGMVGNIYIRGGSSTANISNNADNRVITGGTDGNLNGESALTYSGNILKNEVSDSSGLTAHILVNNSESSAGVSLLGSGSSFSSGGWAAVTDAAHIRSSAGAANGLVLQASAGDMRFYVDGSPTERLRISSSGQIGLSGANYGTSGQVLTSQGSGSAVVWANAGIIMTDQWRITSSSTLGGSVSLLNSNWARVASPSGYGKIGSAMSESSGSFTFPSTGIYLIEFTILLAATSAMRYLGHRVQTTVNNSNYSTVAEELGHIGITNSFGAYHTSSSSYIFDVTNTSTHKIRFAGVAFTPSATDVIGNTNSNSTFATFIRLGDT